MRRIMRRWLACCFTAALMGSASAETVRVNVFPTAGNAPLFVAKDKGFFAKRGLEVDIQFTATSGAQREGLVKGSFDIAVSGVDNAVALVEVNKADVVVVSGGSNGLNQLIVRPEIKAFDDIRGKMLVVDAPNTSFALLLYKILGLKGITKADYGVIPAGGCPQRLAAMKAAPANAAALLYPPCTLLAEKEGFHSLGEATEWVGAYQADGIYVLRAWAKQNEETLVKYIQGVVEGYRFAANPANQAEAAASLARHLKVDADIAAKSLQAAVGPKGGIAKDIVIDLPGFRNSLKIRAETEGGDPNALPEKYLDLSYYQKAMAGM